MAHNTLPNYRIAPHTMPRNPRLGWQALVAYCTTYYIRTRVKSSYRFVEPSISPLTLKLRLMDKILHDLKDPKLWELWYIPYYG